MVTCIYDCILKKMCVKSMRLMHEIACYQYTIKYNMDATVRKYKACLVT